MGQQVLFCLSVSILPSIECEIEIEKEKLEWFKAKKNLKENILRMDSEDDAFDSTLFGKIWRLFDERISLQNEMKKYVKMKKKMNKQI